MQRRNSARGYFTVGKVTDRNGEHKLTALLCDKLRWLLPCVSNRMNEQLDERVTHCLNKCPIELLIECVSTRPIK